MRAPFFVFIFLLATAFSVEAQTGVGMFHQDLSWSPDGKYMAFCGMHDIDRAANKFKADIFVIGVDGSGQRQITGDERNEFYTAWAKGRIAFGAETPGTKDSQIYTVKPDGTHVRQVTTGTGKNSTPAFSKDGKKIAFVSTRDGEKYQIYVINADGTGLKLLTTDPNIGFFNPQFSPNGKQIVYYAEKGDGKDQVWVMNADSSRPLLLTANIGHNIFPGWSTDGKHIIFSSTKRETDTNSSYVDGSYLYLIKPDGSGLAKLGDIKSFFTRFSPDGKKIAYFFRQIPPNRDLHRQRRRFKSS